VRRVAELGSLGRKLTIFGDTTPPGKKQHMKKRKPPTQKEIADWKDFVKRSGIKSIDVPYFFTVGAVTVTGTLHIREPFTDSSTDGVVVGAVNGTYNLNKNSSEAKLYDPTGNLARLVIVFDVGAKELKARLDTRRWDGGWDEGSWAIIWRG
jgi:hypothetical protein